MLSTCVIPNKEEEDNLHQSWGPSQLMMPCEMPPCEMGRRDAPRKATDCVVVMGDMNGRLQRGTKGIVPHKKMPCHAL